MLPTDGISGHLYLSQSVVCEMETVHERARCVGWLFETKSVHTEFNKQPPSDKAIRDWQRRFLETGSVHDRKRSGRPGVSDESVEKIPADMLHRI
jgi:transposase